MTITVTQAFLAGAFPLGLLLGTLLVWLDR